MHNFFGGSRNLQTVAVYHCAEIVQLILGSAHGAFPYGTLGKLSVAHDYVYSCVAIVHLFTQCHTYRNGKAMAERTGIHLDTRQLVVRMSDELGAEFRVLFKNLLEREEALLRQHGIEGFHAVALAEHEHVSVRIVLIFGADIHLVKI